MVGAVEKSGKGWFGADKKLNQPANQAKPNHLPAPSLRRETLSSSALNLIHHIPALHAGSLCCQFLSVCFLNTFKCYRRRLSGEHIRVGEIIGQRRIGNYVHSRVQSLVVCRL